MRHDGPVLVSHIRLENKAPDRDNFLTVLRSQISGPLPQKIIKNRLKKRRFLKVDGVRRAWDDGERGIGQALP